MRYHFPCALHAVAIDDRAILLDLDSDRYSLLGAPAAEAFRALAAGLDHPLHARLVELGILEHGEGRDRAPSLDAVFESAVERDQEPARSPGAATVTSALLRTMFELRRRGLRPTLDRARARHLAPARAEAGLIGSAQAYARHRSRLPFRQICLPDSLALHGLLSTQGFAPTLVIGVRLDPFMAHCWVQAGSMLLNDSIDHVRPYVPIFAL